MLSEKNEYDQWFSNIDGKLGIVFEIDFLKNSTKLYILGRR